MIEIIILSATLLFIFIVLWKMISCLKNNSDSAED
jgi:hypothetical protein